MSSPPSGPPPELAGLPPSSHIGKFIRTTLLGRGGCGDVYKAWDTELNRWVALKFLRGDDEAESARLRREAQTAARLNHPNICAVYEVAVHEGRPFIAMQYIDGAVLSHKGGPRRAVRYLRDAALAVHYAHQQGVIHRDLKPANLMLEESGDAHEPRHGSSANRPSPQAARVYVMDFGLAKQTASASSLSVSGLMVGTPAYMPPEQARGQNQSIDARSDVYSLGATLYELVTGAPPFIGSNAVDIAMQIVDTEPPPPRRLKPELDADLETIILKCLEKEPARRYATAEDLAADLSRWLAGEPILAHPPSTLYRFRKRLRKHVIPVVIAVAAIAAIAAVAAVTVPRMLADRKAREAAERRQTVLQELNRLWAEFLVVREWTRQPFRDPAAVRGARLRAIDGIRQFVLAHPDLASAWYVQARVSLHDGRLEESWKAAERAIQIDPGFEPARATASQARLEMVWRTLHDDTTYNEMRGETLTREARAGLANLSDPAPERFGLARTEDDAVAHAVWTALAQSAIRDDRAGAVAGLVEAHRRSPSEELCRWIAQLTESHAERTKWIDEAVRIAPHWTAGRMARASHNFVAGRYRQAETDATAAVELDPGNAHAYGIRAACRVRLDRADEALEDYGRAIDLLPDEPVFHTGRGAARKDKGDLKGALADHTRALELSPDYPSALTNRGIVHALLGDRDAAMVDLDRAVDVAPKSSRPWAFRGMGRDRFGDHQGAILDYTAALAIQPRDAQTFVNRGNSHRDLGHIREALADFTSAVDLSPDSIVSRTNRGLLRREVGDFRGSMEDFDHAVTLAPKNAEPWMNRAKTKHAMRDIEGSIADNTHAIGLRPDWAIPYYNRALAKAAKNDGAGAIADYTLAIERDAKYVDAYSNRGLLHLNSGALDLARPDLVTAAELAPESPITRTNLGVLFSNLGDKEGAVREFERALKLAPPRWPFRAKVEQLLRAARGE